ncbi:hypothetical protein [Paenibacillus sp. FJAT-26967]|uniref:hypothetical protein n=1 Tax=Paenibacillus sp. FJAT-26967 TaxID=1729690 RepID=UPI000837BCF0|nr:hypothetical protein [Paenibacillus sp. FJAT-26967]
MYKLLKVFFLLGLIFIFNPENSYAEKATEAEVTITNIETTADSINLAWSGNKKSIYQVIDLDGKIVQESDKQNFTQTKLTPGTSVEYFIKELDEKGKEKKENTIKVKAQTKKKSIETTNLMEGKTINIVKKKKKVIMDWDDFGNGNYQIYKNDELLVSDLKKSNYSDNNYDDSKYTSYKIVSEHQDKNEKKDLVLVKNIDKNESNTLTALAYDIRYSFKYRTYIPEAYTRSPTAYRNIGWDGYYGGDTRTSPCYTCNSARTDTRFIANFSSINETPYYSTLNKYIWPTRWYDLKYKPLDSKTASDDNIYLYPPSTFYDSATGKIKWKIYHNALIAVRPVGGLVPAPGITYEYIGEINRSGKYIITGNHDKAPSHELWFVTGSPDDNGYAVLAYSFKNQGFDNLFPPYPNADFTVSN